MADFLQSETFMWIAMIIILSSIITIALESFSDHDGLWYDVWDAIKKPLFMMIGYLLLPIIMIYGVFFLDGSKPTKHK